MLTVVSAGFPICVTLSRCMISILSFRSYNLKTSKIGFQSVVDNSLNITDADYCVLFVVGLLTGRPVARKQNKSDYIWYCTQNSVVIPNDNIKQQQKTEMHIQGIASCDRSKKKKVDEEVTWHIYRALVMEKG